VGVLVSLLPNARQSRACRNFSNEQARHHRQPFPKASAICRKSYVHDTIVTAFEDGILERFAATMKGYRSQSKREQLLAQVVMAAAA
jgi:DNA topoisomerase I